MRQGPPALRAVALHAGYKRHFGGCSCDAVVLSGVEANFQAAQIAARQPQARQYLCGFPVFGISRLVFDARSF